MFIVGINVDSQDALRIMFLMRNDYSNIDRRYILYREKDGKEGSIKPFKIIIPFIKSFLFKLYSIFC